MENRVLRIRLTDDMFRKYKVYCAMNDLSMTEQTSEIIKKFITECDAIVKIVKVPKT